MGKKWWLDNQIRMIQNNIRDIDAGMDLDYEIQMLKYFGANVLQIGCGGISAFSDTKLAVQKKSPQLKDDMFGKLLEKCHENGIRVIARFDVSKTHDSFLQEHPDWFSRSLKGEVIRYHDTLATCVNGPYQQKETLNIIEDIIKHYPVDGIFFNMFGYQTFDYGGNYVGICQCENCKRRFKEIYHMDLPTEEDEEDPVFQAYKEFKTFTVAELLNSIADRVHSIRDDIAVSTYADEHVDIIRMESNSAVDRPLPFWIYQSSENVEPVLTTFQDKAASNVAINAVDLPYRFMGVSKYLNEIRLFENMANGGALDWCIIGSFEDYPDRENYETTRAIFQFQKKYEEYYRSLKPQARILMIQPRAFYQPPFHQVHEEYRGIYKMLKESHYQFVNVIASNAGLLADRLDEYDVIIIPDISDISDEMFKEKLKETQAVVIATGMSFERDKTYLEEVFGVLLKRNLPVRGSYMLTEPKEVFHDFEERDWVYVDKRYMEAEAKDGVEKLLPYITDASFGPPERCFGHMVTDIPSVTVKDKRRIYFPWMPGALYYSQGYEDFKKIFFDVLLKYGKIQEAITVAAPPSVEVLFSKVGEKAYLLHLLNLSGFNGMTVDAPLPIRNIEIHFNTITPKHITELKLSGKYEEEASQKLVVSELNAHKVYLIEE